MPDILEMDSDDVLAHYGVPGMRWGKRKGSSDKTGRSLSSKITNTHEDAAAEIRKKPVRSMSNADLRKINERLQLEKTYAELTTTTSGKQKVSKGAKVATGILKSTVGVAKTVDEAYKIYNGPLGKAIISAMK